MLVIKSALSTDGCSNVSTQPSIRGLSDERDLIRENQKFFSSLLGLMKERNRGGEGGRVSE